MDDPAEAARRMAQEDIMARPVDQFQDLPLEFRWEATRRHPYYLLSWSSAAGYLRGDLDHDTSKLLDGYAAYAMLGLIGVNGPPVDPRTSFHELGVVDSSFLSGAVQPIQLRVLVKMLIQALPSKERVFLGDLLVSSADETCAIEGDDESLSLQRQTAITELSRTPSAALDSYPVMPLVYLHLGASQRTILSDVTEQVRRWKKLRGIPERRVPTKKLASFLEVWDLREGWTGDGYDRRQERTLLEIAQHVKRPLSTVFERYMAAFKMITGYDFTLPRWEKLILKYKAREWLGNPATDIAPPIRRRLFVPAHRPAPDSVVSPARSWGSSGDNSRRGGVVQNKATTTDDHEAIDLLLDIRTLLDGGKTDADIAQKLECDVKLVEYLRGRGGELAAPEPLIKSNSSAGRKSSKKQRGQTNGE